MHRNPVSSSWLSHPKEYHVCPTLTIDMYNNQSVIIIGTFAAPITITAIASAAPIMAVTLRCIALGWYHQNKVGISKNR